jgi:hypothetical protein
MSNYVKATNFYTKDALLTGNPAKIIKGAEIDDEFNAIATAVASKADTTSPTFTGTPIAPTAAPNTNTTQIATTAFVTAATGTLGTMATQNANAVAITGGTVAATFTGNLTGNTAGVHTGAVTGNVTGNVTGSSGSCTGNAATATSAANAIGVGQTWQDVSGSRSSGTTYTNSTGRPIFVSVRMDRDDGQLDLTVDGLMVGRSGTTPGPVYYTLTAIVPAGSTYKADATSGLSWYELR